jgi:hypothetical protein
MAGKADFTSDEWEALHKGATGAGLLVSVSDRGFFDSFKEAGALARHVQQARSSSSGVVRELAEERGVGFGITSAPSDVESETLAALRTGVAALEEKAPDEVDAYREFVLDVARSVASAAEGGDEQEGRVIEQIQSAVGASAHG